MIRRVLRLHSHTYGQLIRLSKEADYDEPAVWRSLRKLYCLVDSERRSSGDLSRALKASLSNPRY